MKRVTPWVDMGVTVHRLLLPDAWRSAPSDKVVRTLYLVSPLQPPVRDLRVRVLNLRKQRIFVEQWCGLRSACCRPANAQYPAPNLDRRFFARFTAVLRLDPHAELPASLQTVEQPRGMDRGHLVWGRTDLVSQTPFHYGGSFFIAFAKV